MKFEVNKCPKCNTTQTLMFSNNPLTQGICFSCIKQTLKYDNMEHADFFCRTYNIPLVPELWIKLAEEVKDEVFQQYTEMILEDDEYKPNLAYGSSTKDIWSAVNKEWEKRKTLPSILDKIGPVKESYVERGHLKWGIQYTFYQLVKLDSIYTKTLKSNNITNPLQKEAVKTLCKLQVELDEAVAAKDVKAMKDISTAYANFAKQADLETMINETKTDDITTVAELYQYMEKKGFQFTYYTGAIRDEVDKTIQDFENTIRRLVLESTQIAPTLEQMIRDKQRSTEEEYAEKISDDDKLEEVLNMSLDDVVVEKESDDEVLDIDFTTDSEIDLNTGIKVIKKEG